MATLKTEIMFTCPICGCVNYSRETECVHCRHELTLVLEYVPHIRKFTY